VYWGQLCVLGAAMCIGDSYVYWGQLCVQGAAMCIGGCYVYWGQLCVLGTAMCVGDSYVCWGQLCVLGTAMFTGDSYVCKIGSLCFFIRESYVRSVSRYYFIRYYAAIPVQLEDVVLQYISCGAPIVWTFVFNPAASACFWWITFATPPCLFAYSVDAR
jgi:hypothetical protein